MTCLNVLSSLQSFFFLKADLFVLYSILVASDEVEESFPTHSTLKYLVKNKQNNLKTFYKMFCPC